MARNLILKHWRKQQPAKVAANSEVMEMLSLRYEARKTVKEVTRAMGQTFDAVTKSLYRLRQALADCVERKLSHRT